MKRVTILNTQLTRIAAGLLLTSIAVAGFALTQVTPSMSVEQMSKEADEIVVGNVVGKTTRIVANSFETDYQIQVHESLKTKSAALSPGQTFTMTLPGGSIQEPPLTQYAMGAPYMYKGEEVLLFLKQGSGKQPRLPRSSVNAGERSNLSQSYKVVGWNQGRFTVITRQDTGEKIVTRLNMENYGLTNTSADVKAAAEAIAQNQVPTVHKAIARSLDMAADARAKDPLEFTSADGKQIRAERTMQKAEAIKLMRQRALSVQDMDEFKAQIKAFVNAN